MDAAAAAIGFDTGSGADVEFAGHATLASAYPVSDLAAGAVGAAALAAARLAGLPAPIVYRELVDGWFGAVVVPASDAVVLPPAWDPLAANYLARDGWIRLHTNAPAHRAAALRALGLEVDPEAPDARERVAAAVASRPAREVEDAVVAEGGAAGELRTAAEWSAHPQGRAVAAEPLIAVEPTADRRPTAGSTDRPLDGIRVLDLTRVLAGPTGTQFLAGLGADVLRVDPPDWDEPAVLPHVMSGKRSARVDVRTASGRRTLRALLADADVLVHGLRPGALERLGFGDGELTRIRPGLVDVRLDAYGWTGPWAGRRAFDSVVQLSSGIADTGMRESGADVPVALPVQALDVATGYLMAAAALAGLGSGRGSRSRLSLARTAVELERMRGRVASGELTRADPHPAGHLPRVPVESGWGPLLRLVPPVEGLPLRWDLPPRPLGSDAPEW